MTWYVNGVAVVPPSGAGVSSSVKFGTTTGSLVRRLTPDDDGANYTCAVQNGAIEQPVFATGIRLRVECEFLRCNLCVTECVCVCVCVFNNFLKSTSVRLLFIDFVYTELNGLGAISARVHFRGDVCYLEIVVMGHGTRCAATTLRGVSVPGLLTRLQTVKPFHRQCILIVCRHPQILNSFVLGDASFLQSFKTKFNAECLVKLFSCSERRFSVDYS